MDGFVKRRLIAALCVCSLISISEQTFASGFQLFEQDGASVGNYHAGYAALANDASTAFYNPAGINRIKTQQLVISADSVMTDFKYQGTIAVNMIDDNVVRPVTAQGGNYGFVPALHYVAPISDLVGFGFSIDVPFGLKTTFGRTTIIQYAATTTAATVVDVSPSFGLQLTDKGSFGFGLDIQRMDAEFDQVGGVGLPTTNAECINKLSDTGYGGHFGVLYQFTPDSRVGLSYHTQVVHHLNGSSTFIGPIATAFAGGPYSGHAYTNLTLPAYTALSAYHRILPKVALMGSIVYTQWNVFRVTSLHGVAGIENLDPSTNINVNVPQYYNNTWNVSVGADYDATDKITLRCGVGYDQTPTTDAYRNATLPDNNRLATAIGGHYQSSPTLGFDVGWTHLMLKNTPINPPPLVTGDQVTTTVGNVKGGADVIAGQLTWNIE